MGDVTDLPGGGGRREQTTDDRWLRHQAMQIAGHLPETGEDALAILDYARAFYLSCLGSKPSS